MRILADEKRGDGRRGVRRVARREQQPRDPRSHIVLRQRRTFRDHGNAQRGKVETRERAGVATRDDPTGRRRAHDAKLVDSFAEETHDRSDAERGGMEAQPVVLRTGPDDGDVYVWMSLCEQRECPKNDAEPIAA